VAQAFQPVQAQAKPSWAFWANPNHEIPCRAVSAPPLRVTFHDTNEKKPRTQTPPLCEETLLKFPGFPEPRNLFHSSRRERRRTFVRNVPWHLSLHRQRSGHLSSLPAISAQPAHLEPSGYRWLSLRANAGCHVVQSGGQPAPRWGAAWKLFPRNLNGAQTELSSDYIIITLGEKARGQGNFLKKIWVPEIVKLGLMGMG